MPRGSHIFLTHTDDASKNYKDYQLRCSLEVLPGHITGLIGQNGAGKSTTFKAILGLIQPDGGEVKVLGKDAKDLREKDKKRMGIVFSDSGFSTLLRVKDIVPVLSHLYDDFDKARFLELCKKFGLPTDKAFQEFSTGMKAKLKVLIAITHTSELLILDEPTSGLDVIARDEILGMLRDFMDENPESAILISSHISSDLETLCDDLYMIHDGEIILHEETDVLMGEYAILKLDEETMQGLDRSTILRRKKEGYGYQCLTGNRQFYLENYPNVVVEKSSIDDLIYMMIKGEKVC